jgi:hypothetical protein
MKSPFILVALTILAVSVRAGDPMQRSMDAKSFVTAATTEPSYREAEWNIALWGSYALTGGSYRDDQYLEADHGWGGGINGTYFFSRYLGFGLEAYGFNARRAERVFESRFLPLAEKRQGGDERTLGAVLPRFTVRLPLVSSAFAPYLFAAGGAIFGGGEASRVTVTVIQLPPPFGDFATITHVKSHGAHVRAVGELGAGFEFRVTHHIGIVNEFAWDAVQRGHSNFGMLRTGINLVF